MHGARYGVKSGVSVSIVGSSLCRLYNRLWRYLFMEEKALPFEKKSVTVVNSVTGVEEKLPALVSKIINQEI